MRRRRSEYEKEEEEEEKFTSRERERVFEKRTLPLSPLCTDAVSRDSSDGMRTDSRGVEDDTRDHGIRSIVLLEKTDLQERENTLPEHLLSLSPLRTC